ncbi:MAG: ribonuclease P protein component [Minisyncoccia bacterium]
MLAKKYRISSEDIGRTIKNGKSFHADHFYGKFALNNTKNSRFAVVSSIKIEKTSVGRHLLKRRISSTIESFFKKNPKSLEIPFDLIIFSKKGAPLLSFFQISIEVSQILENTHKNF